MLINYEYSNPLPKEHPLLHRLLGSIPDRYPQ
jgi:hypothetical protein